MNSEQPSKRRRFLSIGLRSLLVLLTVAAVVLGVCTNQMRQQRRALAEAERRRRQAIAMAEKQYAQAIAMIERLGGEIRFGDERQLTKLQREFATQTHNVYNVNLSGTQVTDADLAQLKALKSILFLKLRDTKVTDDGLRHLNHSSC